MLRMVVATVAAVFVVQIECSKGTEKLLKRLVEAHMEVEVAEAQQQKTPSRSIKIQRTALWCLEIATHLIEPFG